MQTSSLSKCRSKWDFSLGVSSFRVFDFSVHLTFLFFLQCVIEGLSYFFVITVHNTCCESLPIKTIHCLERIALRFYSMPKLYACCQLWSYSVHMESRRKKGGSSDAAVLKPALQLITQWLLLLFAFVDFEQGASLWLPLEEPILPLDKHPISEAWYNSL